MTLYICPCPSVLTRLHFNVPHTIVRALPVACAANTGLYEHYWDYYTIKLFRRSPHDLGVGDFTSHSDD